MEQRLSLMTLGCTDPEAVAPFYEAMGWTRVAGAPMPVFNLPGQVLGLYKLEMLAEDLGLPIEALGTGKSTLGYNTRSKEEVDTVMARAFDSGAKILRPPSDIFWGGYVGYFADPEGHIWEVTWNPFAPPAEGDGAFQWPATASSEGA